MGKESRVNGVVWVLAGARLPTESRRYLLVLVCDKRRPSFSLGHRLSHCQEMGGQCTVEVVWLMAHCGVASCGWSLRKMAWFRVFCSVGGLKKAGGAGQMAAAVAVWPCLGVRMEHMEVLR